MSVVNIVVKVFHIWHSDPYIDRLRPSRESTYGVMADKKQFSNTKSIVKVETGIVTLISYHHYSKIVGNNGKLNIYRSCIKSSIEVLKYN
jgi:hypothetical protein